MRRAFVLCGTTAVVFAVHCGGSDAVEYGPEGDTRVANDLLGTWTTSDGTLTITICEDRSIAARACSKAVADIGTYGGDQRCHPMKSDGSSARESLAAGGGCDSSDPYASLPVTVALSRAGGVALHGEIDVAPSGTDGYGGAKDLVAETSGTGFAGSVGGVFDGPTLHVRVSLLRGYVKPDASVGSLDASEDASDASDGSDASDDAGDATTEASSDASTNDASSDAGDAGDTNTPTDASAPPADAGTPPTTGGRPEAINADLTRTIGVEACR